MLQGFAVLVLVLGLASACSPAPVTAGCSPATPPVRLGSPAAPSARLGSPALAGPGLVVAERGFARVGRSSFSLGAIVSNSSSRAAYRTTVLFRLLDSAGAVIFAFDERTLPMVLPGARLPAGVAIDLPPDRVVPVAGVSVELGGTHWVDVEPDNRLFRRYDTLAEASDGGQLRLPADMGSQPCAGLSASAAALVYRDASGSVVGGEEVAYTGSYCAGSHFGDVLNALYVPLEADRARTLIAVYCDT